LLALNRRAETSGFLGCAALAAAPVRALGTSQTRISQMTSNFLARIGINIA
jgi:hypothetical protein